MQPLIRLSGTAAPMLDDDIDTDQLCPKQHLTRLERQGFGDALFSDRRNRPDGSPDPDFVLNQPPFRDACIIVGGNNFGCGSSREHAVWSLVDYGIRCVIAPSFGEIFAQNAVNSGLLLIKLPRTTVVALGEVAETWQGATWSVNVEAQSITTPDGGVYKFEIDPVVRMRLLEGLDEIGLTLRHKEAIAEFEGKQRLSEPWLW